MKGNADPFFNAYRFYFSHYNCILYMKINLSKKVFLNNKKGRQPGEIAT